MSVFRIAALVLLAAAAPALAQSHGLPVPAQVIYPGDRIVDAMLADSPDFVAPQPNALSERAEIVGKAARRTLLPGRPIPPGAVEEARVVSVGALVSLVYEADGIAIATTGQAMQNGFAGQVVQARNLDSGVVVIGVVQPDGSIHLKGG